MMGKIKLNLVSGSIVEKPLITAFKANGNEYVVLDNEMNGSMGLPIILVCKLSNNRLVKINDQNEWQIVKEYLKNIIAGNPIEFIPIAKEISADDIYYTQLTLPVPSFDTLKKSYNISDEPTPANVSNNDVGIMDLNLNTPEQSTSTVEPTNVPPIENTPNVNVTAPTPEIPVMPSAPEVPNMEPVNANPEPIPSTPVVDIQPNINPTPVVDLSAPVINNDAPANIPPVTPVMPEAPVSQEAAVIMPETPAVEPAPIANKEDRFKDQKEAFMQACENMFDALVQKFEKELENNK